MTNYFRVDIAASLFAIAAGIIHLGAWFGFWWSTPISGTDLYWRVGISVALIVIAVIGVGIFSGITNRDAPSSDEREIHISFRAMRNMLFVYSGGLAILFMEAFAGVSEPMALAHSVIGIFIFAEVVRLFSLAYYARQGA